MNNNKHMKLFEFEKFEKKTKFCTTYDKFRKIEKKYI